VSNQDHGYRVRETVHTRALQRAAEILGGIESLQSYLGVPQVRLAYWMEGSLTPPPDAFLKVVDLLLVQEMAQLQRVSAPPHPA
jgi:hypothetical protein